MKNGGEFHRRRFTMQGDGEKNKPGKPKCFLAGNIVRAEGST